jgi:hypothetical protein
LILSLASEEGAKPCQGTEKKVHSAGLDESGGLLDDAQEGGASEMLKMDAIHYNDGSMTGNVLIRASALWGNNDRTLDGTTGKGISVLLPLPRTATASITTSVADGME